MREIKFRFWDNLKKSWRFWIWENLKTMMCFDAVSYEMEDSKRFEINQYTGLKDKNWVEIYENDIVDWKQSEPSNYEIQFIEWWFCLTRPELEWYTTDISSVYPSYWCQIEVIWNIYENPELLIK